MLINYKSTNYYICLGIALSMTENSLKMSKLKNLLSLARDHMLALGVSSSESNWQNVFPFFLSTCLVTYFVNNMLQLTQTNWLKNTQNTWLSYPKMFSVTKRMAESIIKHCFMSISFSWLLWKRFEICLWILKGWSASMTRETLMLVLGSAKISWKSKTIEK